MKINIGCGIYSIGDINCDLYIEDIFNHRNNKTLNPKKIENFVLCDVQYLPFKTNSFSDVYCSHVIEHIKNPYLLLKELRRICKNKGEIIIRCPHRFSFAAKFSGHINFFNRKWFQDNIKDSFEISVSEWFFIPFFRFFSFPNEIKITITVNKK